MVWTTSGDLSTLFTRRINDQIFERKSIAVLGAIIGISGCIWIDFVNNDSQPWYIIYFAFALMG